MSAKIIEAAEANQALMDGTMAPILKLIAKHDVVFAVWADHERPEGAIYLIVKGAERLRSPVG